MKLSSINPATGELIESFEEISDADLEAALQRARQTFRTYRSTSFAERAAWLQALLPSAITRRPALRASGRSRSDTRARS